MTEPRRLKDDDDFAATLLRSAADDGPKAASRHAIAAALGISALAQGTTAATAATAASAPVAGAGGAGGAAGAGTGAAAAIAGKAGVSIFAKVLIGATLVTGVGVVMAVRREPTREEPMIITPAPIAVRDPGAASVPMIPPPITPGLAPMPPVIAPAVPAVPAAPAAPASLIVQGPRTAVVRSAPTPASPPQEAPAPDQPPRAKAASLAEEVAVLDRVLVALREHNAAAALRQLDQYDRQFANGTLASEAEVARIEATWAVGDRTRARALAGGFLAAHPSSPLARRVRALVQQDAESWAMMRPCA